MRSDIRPFVGRVKSIPSEREIEKARTLQQVLIDCVQLFVCREPEVQVIDHLTQQYKLFPQLAKSIIFKMAGDYLWDLYDQVTSEMDQGNVDRLPEVSLIYFSVYT